MKQAQSLNFHWKLKRKLELAAIQYFDRPLWLKIESQSLVNLENCKIQIIEGLGKFLQTGHPDKLKMALEYMDLDMANPNFLQRNWLNFLLALLGVLSLENLVKSIDIPRTAEVLLDCILASRNLFRTWILQPLLKIWNTIRYSESSFIIADEQALKADIDVFNKMVEGYAKDSASPYDRVLQDYENNLKHPIKNALLGDLIRLILIQVQKVKIDGGAALLSLDKLLLSNQLNFELMAVIPVLGLSYLGFSKAREIWSSLRGRSQTQLRAAFKAKLWKMHSILTDVTLSENQTVGYLAYESYLLKNIRSSQPDSDVFTRDYEQLVNSKTSIDDKKWILLRMQNCDCL